MKWKKVRDEIRPVSHQWLERSRERLDNLTKPTGSLGVMETLAARFAAIREEIPITLPKKEICVFVGDHDVVEEGVSAYPQEVTALMVKNFLIGGAGINVLARCAGAGISVIDIGINPNVRLIPDSRMVAWMPAGMVTVGIGDNTWAGGENNSSFELYNFLANSTLKVDGKVLVKDGVLKP